MSYMSIKDLIKVSILSLVLWISLFKPTDGFSQNKTTSQIVAYSHTFLVTIWSLGVFNWVILNKI